MEKKANIFATELWPKEHDWILSAFGAPVAIAVGLLVIPYWRLSLLALVVASSSLTHVGTHFRGRAFGPRFAVLLLGIITVCFFLLVRTGYIAEDSVVMRGVAFGWLGIIVVQCASVVRSVLRGSPSKKGEGGNNE